MSEIMEKEELSAAGPQEVQQAPAKRSLKEKWKAIPRKKRRRIVRWIVILVVLAAAGFGLYKLLGGKGEEKAEVVTDFVQYGAPPPWRAAA